LVRAPQTYLAVHRVTPNARKQKINAAGNGTDVTQNGKIRQCESASEREVAAHTDSSQAARN
jgi:hypothetical protein